MTTPRYQDIKGKDITEMTDDDGTHIRIIAGDYRGYKGPVDGIAAEPQYLDVTLPPRTYKRFPFDTRRQGFAYIFEGSARFKDASSPFGVKVEKEFNGEELEIRDLSGNRTLVVFDAGDEVAVSSGNHGVRFLLISGAPLREPVAWANCDEHPRGIAYRNARAEQWDIYQNRGCWLVAIGQVLDKKL